MADLEDVKKGQPTTGKPKTTATATILPDPKGLTFKVVENPKTFVDDKDKSKSGMKVALVPIRAGAFEFEASIYHETAIVQTPEGRFADESLAFRMPRGIKITGVAPSDLHVWKDQVIERYEAWQAETGESLTRTRLSTPGTKSLGRRKLADSNVATA